MVNRKLLPFIVFRFDIHVAMSANCAQERFSFFSCNVRGEEGRYMIMAFLYLNEL